MSVLVVYGSRYGATRGIAERIGETLRACGHEVDVREASPVLTATAYDAFVIGSAAYRGSWLEGPVDFVMRHVDVLAERPVWLFSSGPLGTETEDEKGRDVRVAATPKDVAGLAESLHAKGHRVFFGALDPDALRGPEGLMAKLPGGRKMLPEGDFRDWDEIDGWAQEIGRELHPA
jgi:menaquinone-dependent protoporphyrinogen oxidase